MIAALVRAHGGAAAAANSAGNVPLHLAAAGVGLALSTLIYSQNTRWGGYQRTAFLFVRGTENATLISPAPRKLLRAEQATRGIECRLEPLVGQNTFN